MLYHLLL